jgi:hypothetical protein
MRDRVRERAAAQEREEAEERDAWNRNREEAIIAKAKADMLARVSRH